MLLKARVGKLQADIGESWDAVAREDFAVLGITREHLVALAGLPMHHRDPFDHLLIAQAIVEDALLVSNDAMMHACPVQLLPV